MRSILWTLVAALIALVAPSAQAATGIVTHGHTTCAIMQSESNKLYCWGKSDQCQAGVVCGPDVIYPSGRITSGVTQISMYEKGTCATHNGGAKCWGDNTFGQLAKDPAITARSGSTSIYITGLSTGVAEVVGGYEHVCARTTAGAIKCWGANTFGQLGNGTTTNSWTPVTAVASGATALAAGASTTCALVSGAVKCWGLYHGNAAPPGQVLTPTAVTGLGSGVTQLDAGDSHLCVVQSGALKCWGNNAYGQLGTGTFISQATPTAVGALPSGVAAVTAGTSDSCAFKTTGQAYCWGRNNRGQLALLPGLDMVTPTLVSGISSTTQMSSGTENTCSLSSGHYYCWGDGGDKQLGAYFDGTWPLDPTSVPFQFYFWGGP